MHQLSWQARIDHAAYLLDVTFFDYQLHCFEVQGDRPIDVTKGYPRFCLYYKTGAGKSITALTMVYLASLSEQGVAAAVVIAPPSTHAAWEETAAKLGIKVTTMSHAKFRMPGTKLDRTTPVIADEMHMFGGHGGKGWQKLNRLAKGLQAPLIMASATPNYNDADRVYCIHSILDPIATKGGFLEFIYKNCTTEQNPFGMMPIVTGFQRFNNAEEYLAALDYVMYLPDDTVYTIADVPLTKKIPTEMRDFGYDARNHRMIASTMEERHTVTFQSLVKEGGGLRLAPRKELIKYIAYRGTPVLVYCNHATIAKEVMVSLAEAGHTNASLVTGKTPKKKKEELIQNFRDGKSRILVGTASLATGTDGLDKVCDTLIIVDDTDDDSLRRQLIGRIMPRGGDTDASAKQIIRFNLL